MKKLNDATLAFFLCSVIFVLCYFSADAKAGALAGLRSCEEIIIPSLLPVLILCSLMAKSRAAIFFEAVFGGVFERVLKLPRCTVPAVIFGMVGGYPTGILLTHQLFEANRIDSKTAARLSEFNLCGGCAFLITAVGTVTYGSTKIGLLLLLCSILSSLVIALMSSIHQERPKAIRREAPLPFADALPQAAEATVKALAVMSAYIILFSAVNAIAKPPTQLLPLLEIASGVCSSELPLPLPYAAFFLSFGGLCIHLQLFGLLRNMKVHYFRFLFGRVLSSLLSYALMRLYLFFFPQSASVFSNLSAVTHRFSSGGTALSLIMIIGCAVVIFDIENRKLKLI